MTVSGYECSEFIFTIFIVLFYTVNLTFRIKQSTLRFPSLETHPPAPLLSCVWFYWKGGALLLLCECTVDAIHSPGPRHVLSGFCAGPKILFRARHLTVQIFDRFPNRRYYATCTKRVKVMRHIHLS